MGPVGPPRMIGDHQAKIAAMTRYYDLDEADRAVPELTGIVRVLGEQRAELVRLRDEVLARGGGGGDGAPQRWPNDRSARPRRRSRTTSA